MKETNNWTSRFKVTQKPMGAAAMFILAHCRGEQGKHAQEALASLLKEYWNSGYEEGKASKSI